MIPSWLSLIDVAFVAIVLLFATTGSRSGCVGQLPQVFTILIMGVYLFFGHPYVYHFISKTFRTLDDAVLVWFMLFGMAAMAVALLMLFNKLFGKVLGSRMSEGAERVFGFALGLVRGVLICVFAMVFFVILGPPKIYDNFRLKSQVGKLVCYELVPHIQPHLSRPVMENKVEKAQNRLLDRKEGGVLD